MNHALGHLLYFGIINGSIVLAGYQVVKRQMVLVSWLMLAASIALVYVIFMSDNPVVVMLAIIATTFIAMKLVSVTEGYRNKKLTLGFKQWAVFTGGWAGMRAQPFETLGNKALPNAWPMIRFGISRVIIGLLFIAAAHFLVSLQLNGVITYVIVSAILLVGLSLILHFGLLSISAGAWRLSGVNTYLLFRQPAKATSLTELWSKRWNIAFSEMTSVAIYRPVKKKYGSGAGLMAAFLFSGLLHELALSVPVKAGYGLPTLYFAIQGIMVLIEKLLASRGVLFLQNKLIAHIWVFFWLVAPMPLLFHAEFIRQIVWLLCGLKP